MHPKTTGESVQLAGIALGRAWASDWCLSSYGSRRWSGARDSATTPRTRQWAANGRLLAIDL